MPMKPLSIGIVGLGKGADSLGWRSGLSLLTNPCVEQVRVLKRGSAPLGESRESLFMRASETQLNSDPTGKVLVVDYEGIKESDLVLVTADNSDYKALFDRPTPPERRDILEPNMHMMEGIADALRDYEGQVLIATNPTDELTYAFTSFAGRPALGLNHTDTVRYRREVAAMARCHAGIMAGYNTVRGFVVGPHGPDMMPCFSSTKLNDKLLTEFPQFSGDNASALQEIDASLREIGTLWMRQMRSTADDVVASVNEIVDALFYKNEMFLEQGVELSVPVSAGELEAIGIEVEGDSCLGLPVYFSPDNTPVIKRTGWFLDDCERERFKVMYGRTVENMRQLCNDFGIKKVSLPSAKQPRASSRPEIRMLEQDLDRTEQGRITSDRYKILEYIAQGCFSKVYRAWDKKLRQEVALKVYETVGERQAMKAFQRESQSYAMIRHPNVLRFHEIDVINEELPSGTSRQRYCVVLELAEQTLENHRGMELDKVINVGIQVSAGLEELARKGIVHRDVKPDNLLLFADGTVKIGDLGCACLTNAQDSGFSSLTLAAGAYAYRAPEALTEDAKGKVRREDVNSKMDCYSLAATLYELWRGEPLFGGVATVDAHRMLRSVLQGRLEKEITQLSTPDRWFLEALGGALDFNAAKRYDLRDLSYHLKLLAQHELITSLRERCEYPLNLGSLFFEKEILQDYLRLIQDSEVPVKELERFLEFAICEQAIQDRLKSVEQMAKDFAMRYIPGPAHGKVKFATLDAAVYNLGLDYETAKVRKEMLQRALLLFDCAARYDAEGLEKC